MHFATPRLLNVFSVSGKPNIPASRRGGLGGVSASGEGGITWVGGDDDGGGGFIEECPGSGLVEDRAGDDDESAESPEIPGPEADTLPSGFELIE